MSLGTWFTSLCGRKNPQGEKKGLPLSFGYREGREDRPFWRLKGFNLKDQLCSMYNLHRLKADPKAPICVVEGEKTADAAPKALEAMGRGSTLPFLGPVVQILQQKRIGLPLQDETS